MIEEICKWLPKIIKLEDYNGNWQLYNSTLYKIFIQDFIDNDLYFRNKKVEIRINPKQDNFEHAFIHLTCEAMNESTNLNDRIPDLRRCERIAWNRKIIENYKCNYNCVGCKKILYYEEYYKNTIRINLLFADVNFKVVIEKRDKYYLLITGYYIKYKYRLNKEVARANLYAKQKTPLD